MLFFTSSLMLCTHKITKTRPPMQSEFYRAYKQLYSSSHRMHKKFGPGQSKDFQHACTIQDVEVAEHDCTDTFNAKLIT
jgi:hypothetical protein